MWNDDGSAGPVVQHLVRFAQCVSRGGEIVLPLTDAVAAVMHVLSSYPHPLHMGLLLCHDVQRGTLVNNLCCLW